MQFFLHRSSVMAASNRVKLDKVELSEVQVQNRRGDMVGQEVFVYELDNASNSGSQTESGPY